MQRLELLQDYCHHYFLKTIVSAAVILVISSQLELEKSRKWQKTRYSRRPKLSCLTDPHKGRFMYPRLALRHFRALFHVRLSRCTCGT